MKKKDKEKQPPKKSLLGLLDVLGEIVLYAVCGAIGFGLICLVTSFDFAKNTDPELMVFIGVAAIFVPILAVVLIIRLLKKRKNKDK